ncbi:hypothetical protein [Brevibacterium aurantiacum]|nr:hypothetical protein [Brevibacterium aurantiacum]
MVDSSGETDMSLLRNTPTGFLVVTGVLAPSVSRAGLPLERVRPTLVL